MAKCGLLKGKSFRLSVMFTMTFGYFLVEIIFGYMTNSMSLVADSFHMLSDVLALCIAFACMKIAKKRSRKNTFGWVRAEILGALVNAVFLIALCFSIFVESIKRLLEPEKIKDPLNILIVGAIGLVVNIIGILMFHGHASVGHGHSHAAGKSPSLLDAEEKVRNRQHDNLQLAVSGAPFAVRGLIDDATEDQESVTTIPEKSVEIGSKPENGIKPKKKTAAQLNMHGVFLHILGDAFGSIVVIINAVINWQVDNEDLKKYLDPSLSLVMVLIIMSTTIPLLKETALILLQTVPKYMNVQAIKKTLMEFDGVLAVHEFHVWRLAGEKIIATAHIRFRTLSDYLKVAEKIKSYFHDQEIHSTTIQPEFAEMMGPQESAIDSECFLSCPPESKCDESATCCATVRTPNGNGKGPSIPNDDSNSRLLSTVPGSETALVTERV